MEAPRCWQDLLLEAQSEKDSVRLTVKIAEVEAAMSRRLQQLRLSEAGHPETEAIWRACQELRRLKTDRLKWSRENGWREAS
jgi:hypothetical protein